MTDEQHGICHACNEPIGVDDIRRRHTYSLSDGATVTLHYHAHCITTPAIHDIQAAIDMLTGKWQDERWAIDEATEVLND